jgi:CRP-like cAMP-binding protein
MNLRKMKDKAADLFEKGKYRKAADLFQQIGDQEPDNPRWPQKLGEANKKLGRHPAAVGAFSQAARRYAEKGFLLKAIAMCTMILGLDPDHKGTQTLLANYYAREGGPALPPVGRKRQAAISSEVEAASGGPVTKVPTSTTIEITDEVSQEEAEVVLEAEAPKAPKPASPPPSKRKRRTLAPGESLDAMNLNEVIIEAEPQHPEEKAALDGQVFAIPLDDEEFDEAFDEAFDLGEFEEIEIELEQPPPPNLPPTPIFSSLDKASLRSLIERVTVETFVTGDQIITQGDDSDSLYVLVEGLVSVFQEGTPRVEVTKMEEGAFFGEIALLTHHKRTATVEVSSAEATVIEISREVVGDLIEEHPGVLKVLLRFFRYRLINSLIETSDLFAPFTQEEREKLAFHFAFIEAAKGTTLIRQGQEADALYVLLTGTLETSREEGEALSVRPGGLFGATSMLTDDNDHATVCAASKCWLLKLDRKAFRQVIMTHPQVLAFLTGLVDQRREKIAALEQDTGGLKPQPTSEISLDLF